MKMKLPVVNLQPWIQSIYQCKPICLRQTGLVFAFPFRNYLCTYLLKISLILLLIFKARTIYARDVKPQEERYTPNYQYYHNVSQIGHKLKQLVARNPNYLNLDLRYVSRSGIPQYVLHVTNYSNPVLDFESMSISRAKPKILLSFGEHAREFFPIESLFYFLKNITKGLSASHGSPANNFARLVLGRVDLYIIAMANPDGRRHVERTRNYCWRGTSVGVDLNRNFGWNFGGTGSSGDPNDEEYRGPFVHSEPECQVYIDLTLRHTFDAFVSLHSGIKQIYLPFADSESKKSSAKPVHFDEQFDLARRMAQATHDALTYGVAYEINDYPADGTIFDFMAGVRKIPFSFAIELWGVGDNGKTKCFDLFNPSHEHLQESLHDIMPIYETLFTYMIQWKKKQVHKLFHQDQKQKISNQGMPAISPFIDLLVTRKKLTDTMKMTQEPEFGLPFGYILVAVTFCMFIVMICQQYKPYGLHLYQRRRVVSLRSLSSSFATAGGIKMT